MDTFTHAKNWLREVLNEATDHAKVFLVANKVDKDEDREVDAAKGEAFVKENGLHGFFETSAKTGMNVSNVFMTAAKVLFQQHYRTIRE